MGTPTGAPLRALVALLALLPLIALATACGPSATVDDNPGTLVVYAAREEALVGPVVERFAEASGIDVQVKYGGTTQIVATLLEEGGATPADVFWTRDPGGLGAVAPLLTPLPSDILNLAPEWARSSQDAWVGVSARVRALVYNTDRAPSDSLPKDLWELTEPSWRGRVGWSPTSGPTQTMLTYMRAEWGDARAAQWLQALDANGAVKYGSHTAVVGAVARGESDLGLVNHYYALRYQRENGGGLPIANYHFPGGGPGNLAMVSGAGVLRTARNPAAAHQFLRFLLAEESQRYFTAETFEYPVVEGVGVNPSLTPLSQINLPPARADALTGLSETLAMLRELGIVP